jgi:long-subunit acyl-CoA synthetase (AMP-forming)
MPLLEHRGSDVVEQIWVYGNSYESTLVGIVVPDKKELVGWARDNGLTTDFSELVKDPKVCFARSWVQKINQSYGLAAVWLDAAGHQQVFLAAVS